MPTAQTRELSEDELDLIRHTLVREIGNLQAIYLFGSLARAEARPDSDVDLGILAHEPLAPERRFDLAQKLAAALGRDVDLVDLRSASAVLRMQVIGRGRPIYRLPEAEVTHFEDFVFSDYARLNEERAGILEDVARRGSIHGG